jgi:hypothetical protein
VICYQNLNTIVNLPYKDEIKTHILGMVIQGSEDRNWKVRVALCQNFSQLLKAYGKDMSENTLYSMLKVLISDSEPEVSIACLQSLSKSVNLLSTKNLENLTN